MGNRRPTLRLLITLLTVMLGMGGATSAVEHPKQTPTVSPHPLNQIQSQEQALAERDLGLDPLRHPRGTIPLSHFTNTTGPLRLSDAAGQSDLFIYLAKTSRIKDATVDIRYINSIALLLGRSVLTVRLNETTLAQVKLDPEQSVGVATVRLPAELWRPGFNKLTLSVVQHYTNNCEDPEAPELWTEIDLSRSTLNYEIEPVEREHLLSSLDGLFSPGLGGFGEVLLLTSPSADAAPLRQQALPLVAEALALRRQFAPLLIDHANWLEQKDKSAASPQPALAYLPDPETSPGIHVIVATSDQLEKVLPAKDLPVIEGPKVILTDIGTDRVRLIVTGRNSDEVVAAARTLMVMNDPVTADRQVSFLHAHDTLSDAPLVAGQYLQGDRTYSFKALGVPTTTISGAGSGRVRVSLPLPADFYTHELAKAELALDFAYGSGMGPGSVMNILLNGEFVHGVLLNNPNGAAYHDYRIHLPVRAMVPGTNSLDFNITSRPPLATGECNNVRGRYLMVQVLDNSTIAMPEAGHVTTLPDLARFSSAGFPFVSVTHQADARILIASPDLYGSALTLIGKLAQVARAPVEGWKIDLGLSDHITERAIVLATPADLNAEHFGELTEAVGNSMKWPYRALNDLRTMTDNAKVSVDTLAGALMGENAERTDAVPEMTVTQRSGLGPLGVLLAMRNPAARGDETLLVFTASNSKILTERVRQLVQPELWSQLKGDLVAWKDFDTAPFTMEVTNHYQVGEKDRWLLLRSVISNNPWYWIASTVGVCLAFVVMALFLLRRRHRHLQKGGR